MDQNFPELGYDVLDYVPLPGGTCTKKPVLSYAAAAANPSPRKPQQKGEGFRSTGHSGRDKGYSLIGQPITRRAVGRSLYTGVGRKQVTSVHVTKGLRSSSVARGRGGSINPYVGKRSIDKAVLRDISKSKPKLVTMNLFSQLGDFQRTIGETETVGKPEMMNILVDILHKVATVASDVQGEEQGMASTIIAEVFSERSDKFIVLLKRFVQNSSIKNIEAEKFTRLFQCILSRIESVWECLPIDELLDSVRRLTKAGTNHPKLLEDVENLCELRDQIRDKKVNPSIQSSVVDCTGYKKFPILPEWKEIKEDNGIPPEVRPNKVDSPYTDWVEYYDIQFRLIREDFIASLRRGINALLKGENKKKNRDIRVYNEAKILSQVTTKEMGICFTIKFDVSGFWKKSYDWNHSKRLIFGSLVCLFPGRGSYNESDVLFATITNRDLVGNGKLTVRFESDILKAMRHSKNTVFRMVESSSYFEAVRPVLSAIQRAEVSTMPFTKQLIFGDCHNIQPPIYLRTNPNDTKVYDLKCLYGAKWKRRELKVQILDNDSWQRVGDVNIELNLSQLCAVRTALTQEVAVIQGPPGTGKTYIGLKIVQALLENRHAWDTMSFADFGRPSPILVLCYTNHALDQFLEGIININEQYNENFKVVRVGGRCKNEVVEAFNIKRLRKNTSSNTYSHEIGKLLSELRKCNPQKALDELESHYNRRGLLDLRMLRTVADPDHYYQLNQIVKCKEQKGNEAEVWLDLWTHIKQSKEHKGSSNFSPSVMVDPVEKSEEKLKTDTSSESVITEDESVNDYDEDGYAIRDSFEDDTQLPINTKMYNNDEFSDDDLEEETPKRYRKPNANQLIKKNLNEKIMDEDEVEEIEDISKLNTKDRWRLYNYWEIKRLKYLESENEILVKDYTEKCRKLQELRQMEDGDTMQEADVIGMTTTGAAKHQHILQRIKPKVVIVEEAAEVLEAHIVSALSAGTQHLILIGDHKQLRPKPSEHILATKYNMSISLFERLVIKGMSQATLEIQHRMRPEIAQLICPHVYETLVNHESVEKYPDIRGISKNMYFMCHTEPESENEAVQSHKNEFEAKYIASLCEHLLKIGYRKTQITILTPYVGQLLRLKREMPKDKYEGVRISAIDDYQGEENDIILFSMVRSTNPNSSRTTIGFVKEDNRVCVSLSRAKHGFYAIGNFELIRHQTPLWESIISDVECRDCYGDALPMYCCNHPNTKYSARKSTDFISNAPHGGCLNKCKARLQCGHSCPKICHVADIHHTKYKCQKLCFEKCSAGHPCKSLCHLPCPPCKEKVSKEIPRCKHVQEMKCSDNPNAVYCKEIVTKTIPQCEHKQDMACSQKPLLAKCISRCEKVCESGHQCEKKCFEDCGNCMVPVEKIIPDCEHKQSVPCYLPPNQFLCTERCTKSCPEGHPCKKLCSDKCGNCTELVQKIVPNCNHNQIVMCHLEPSPNYCIVMCEKECPRGSHTLRKKCNERWPECMEMVTKILPKCGHGMIAPCFKDSSSIDCTKRCHRKCPEGHNCPKLCYEKCGKCMIQVTKMLDCGHTHTMPCFKDTTNSFECPAQCLKQICKNDHKCTRKCHFPKACGECKELVSITLPNCSHVNHVECYKSENIDKYKIRCNGPCEKQLICGHACDKKCWERCQTFCSVKVHIGLPCGHHARIECSKRNNSVKCFEKVKVKLSCGHAVQTECWKKNDKQSLKKQCKEKCKNILKCGHPCKEMCNKPCTTCCKNSVDKRLPCGHEIRIKCFQSKLNHPCKDQCLEILPCGHQCHNKCGKPCLTCDKKSVRSYPCGHKSTIPCTSSIDKYPCKKQCRIILSCGHRCSGKCGDCTINRMHTICKFSIKLHRFCGHTASMSCAGLTDSCERDHTIPCSHSRDSSSCLEECDWACKHFKCKEDCGDMCTRRACDKPCDKILACGHRCPGLCGEWCLSVCPLCEPIQFRKQLYPKPKKQIPNEFFYELNCNHIFTVKFLDDYMQSEDILTIKYCPKCKTIIERGNRYGNIVRKAITDVTEIRQQLTDTYDLERFDSFIWMQTKQYYSIEKHSVISDIQSKLLGNEPVTKEEVYLVKCAESYCMLYGNLNSLQYELSGTNLSQNLMRTVNLLVSSAVANLKPPHEFNRLPPAGESNSIHLSWQVMRDFISELYRSALSAQCHLARNTTRRGSSQSEHIVQEVESYLKSLDPLKDRISEDEYEIIYQKLLLAFPATPNIHVSTPRTPRVVKGTWKKCLEGHYYCVPPFFGGGTTTFVCPLCVSDK